jgi:ABC-type molybdenum transport system ATPase subunit/photorepair protein PhrA
MNLCNLVRPQVGSNQKNMRKPAVSCLQVENVSCRYNGRNVLEQLSLTVADNEIVCLFEGSEWLRRI